MKAVVHQRIDAEIKAKAVAIMRQLGLKESEVINLLYRQIIIHGGLPFPVKIPNAETLRAIEETEAEAGLSGPFKSGKELVEHLEREVEKDRIDEKV